MRRPRATLCGLALGGLCAWAVGVQAAVLESPAQGATLSGLGFISGWKCDASTITVTVNGGRPLPVAMHQERGDLHTVCGGTIRHGFILQMNWNLVGDGAHEVVAYDGGREFARATFTVGTTGEEFLEDVTRRTVIGGFPAPGERTVVAWNESTQHFEIVTVRGPALDGAYDRRYWRQYTADQRTRAFTTDVELYAERPDLDACRAGRLTEAAEQRALEAINQIRTLHELPAVRWSTLYREQVQEAALIQAANGVLSHDPAPSAACYTAEGAAGSRTSNFYIGSGDRDPARHFVGWTSDAYNTSLAAAAGNRRWVLNPFAVDFAYGQVAGVAVHKVLGYAREPAGTPAIAVDFVAFPYATYPYQLVAGNPPWSFSLIADREHYANNRGDYFADATISVRRVSDDEALTVRDIYTDQLAFGLPNVLSWQVEGWAYDTLYAVTIRLDAGTRAAQTYTYPVFIERQALEQ